MVTPPPDIKVSANCIQGRQPFQFRLKSLLILVGLLAVFLGFCRCTYIELTYRDIGENVKHVKWLPDTASNVSYVRSYSFTAYEFDISEPDFLAWCWWKTHEIGSPVEVPRYTHMIDHAEDLGPNPTNKEIEAWLENRSARVSSGRYYEYRQSNGGGVRVAYDRKKGRAYVQTSPR